MQCISMSLISNREVRVVREAKKTRDAKMHHTATLKRHCEAATIFPRGLSLSDGRNVIRKAVTHSYVICMPPLSPKVVLSF